MATTYPLNSKISVLEPVQTLIEDFLKKKLKRPLLIILGPTASGKTALSIEVAGKFNGEIISADSRQIYRGMNIGTDKIPVEQREGIPHYLLDVSDPNERFTVADFKRLAEERIDDILARKKLPILVGGTGLYLRAITENFQIPPNDAEVGKKLREDFESEQKKYGREKALQIFHKKLQKLDPKNATKIHPHNMPYIMRALEIVIATGAAKKNEKKPPKYSCLKIGLRRPLEVLTERINRRIEDQIHNGLIEETKKLLTEGYGRNLASMRSLGYREIARYLAGETALQEAVSKLKTATRNFAKRQTTWFKKEQDIVWMEMSS